MPFDLFILGILLFTTIRGAAKGVAWQLAGIGALVLCFMFATPLSLALAPMIKLAPPLNRWVAMLGIYLVFSFGTFSIARGFRGALEKAKFVEFDRHLGALFGLTKGAILSLVITFFAVAMSERTREYVLKTHTGYAAAHIMNALDPVMPKELHAILEPYIHELDAVDPQLQKNREDHHRRLGELDEEEEGDVESIAVTPPKGGYRPNPGQGREESDLSDDPFQSEPDTAAPQYSSGQAGQSAEPATLAEEAQKLLNSLPEMARKIAPAVKQQLIDAFQNTLSEHREELIDELSQAKTPEKVGNIAQTWKSGRPRRQTRPLPPPMEDESFEATSPFETEPTRPLPRVPGRVNAPADRPAFEEEEPPAVEQPVAELPAQRQELLQGIAQIFSSQPAQQAEKMTEIETALLGLPDQVAVRALADWLSDLRGEDPDPDPQTDLTTQLNLRVARQVERLRIPTKRLTPEWQARLEQYLRN